MSSLRSQVGDDTIFGFLDSAAPSHRIFHPQLIANRDGNTMLKAIRDELRRSSEFVFSVAFVTPSAIAMLKQAFFDFEGSGTIITSTYLGFNSPGTFRELLNLDGIEVRVHDSESGGFHPKGYVFRQPASTTAIVGSSNLTQLALLKNREWNLRFSALPGGDIVDQLDRAIAEQLELSMPLTSEWIDNYEKSYVARPKATLVAEAPQLQGASGPAAVRPNAMQLEALAEIQKVRESGERRAVVVSATGTGKTILAALDVRSTNPRRLLFIVHREQILDNAIDEFRRVLDLPPEAVGKLAGSRRETDRPYVFATIQSLSRPENLSAFAADAFDYVIVDEVHRAGANTYRRVLDALRPKFLLGMTATPDRTDSFNVFELFDYNVPYEIRLQAALESDMLAPFHYYGVTDFITAEGVFIDEVAQLSRLVAPERVDYLVSAISKYGQVGKPTRGLMFCSRNDEAAELSMMLNHRELHGRRLRTVPLSGSDSLERRELVVSMLEHGEIDYILTVDIFNEGIDIPSVNQVVMLRQTQSSIVFTQQLGRGLRKSPGKDHLVVIDFIGNYTNNFLIPIALFGDSSLNKDSIRRRLLEAQDAGAISGLSSVSFDAIAKERVFRSLATTTLDSMPKLKAAFADLESRLGKPPALMDFARFDTIDPTVIATKQSHYWGFLLKLGKTQLRPTTFESAVLTFLSSELLNGKRPHELLLLQALMRGERHSQESYRRLLEGADCHVGDGTLESVERVLSLAFFTEAERIRYGATPLVEYHNEKYRLSNEVSGAIAASPDFANHVQDAVETGLFVSRHHRRWRGQLEVGQRYSRKDACRLLNWRQNEQSTIYGYKVDFHSRSCPIFITYHKDDGVAASTRYEDQFLSPDALQWFTRSRRTLASGEVKAITGNSVPLHLFAKKDDAEGTDFYYLGEATSRDPEQHQMPNDRGEPLSVVRMVLDMTSPIELGLYDYLVTPAG